MLLGMSHIQRHSLPRGYPCTCQVSIERETCSLVMAAGGVVCGVLIKKLPNLSLALRVAEELYYTMPLNHPILLLEEK